MTNKSNNKHIKRTARIQTVRLGDLHISPAAQREFKPTHGQKIADSFDLDLMGTLTLSYRDGTYWIVDGQHRFYGLKEYVKRAFGDDWEEWTIEAWTHSGLSETEEAELFLTFNSSKPVSGLDKFRVSVTAERDVESDVDRIVRALGLKVQSGGAQNAISSVGSLVTAYRQGGPAQLTAVLVALRDAWNGFDLDGALITSTAAVMMRYAGTIKGDRLAQQLGSLKNGASGVYQEASRVKVKYGATARDANSAAIVTIYNKGLGPVNKARLSPWFKSGDEGEVA